MKRFVAIERTAVEEIISNRLFQSTDFESGNTLAALLHNDSLKPTLNPRLLVETTVDGLFILSAIAISKDYVVFDLEECGLFSLGESPTLSLLFLQKILRFAMKHWNGLRPSGTERMISNSTKAIIFPFPISQKTSFRISIELAPDAERQAKRPSDGRCILVYKSGTEEGDGRKEEVSATNFRKFLEARRALPARSLTVADHKPVITSLNVTMLDLPENGAEFLMGGYEQWLSMLTDKQKNFVLSPLKSPHRIEGPAGTGKTLSLMLKAIGQLRLAKSLGVEHKSLFITHSEATRRAVEQQFAANDPDLFMEQDPLTQPRSLVLTTLHQLCGSLLGKKISESELIDRDAMESKQMQVLYVDQAVGDALREDFPTYRKFMSPSFVGFLEKTDRWALSEMVQHEISVVIKGRAEEQLDHYKKLPRLKYGLPVDSLADRGFIWQIFARYQNQLKVSAQFDTDDVVLTTIGQLDTPIWRRRRGNEGYDSIFIDETHLFNVNELSIFHHMPKVSVECPIAYSVDRSQAIGDRDWSDEMFDVSINPGQSEPERIERTRIDGIFRCSPDIVDLAFSVTSAGATLFTNFDDPLALASSMFTADEERKAAKPIACECSSDEEMVERAFAQADQMAKEMEVMRGDIAIIAFSEELFGHSALYAEQHNKPVELIKQRGDVEAVQRAARSGRFILTTPEYVGGLEFAGIVLVGLDQGRVPPVKALNSIDSSNFLTYAAHNRLYVAITRARYRVRILASKERGLSTLLTNAIALGILEQAAC